MYKIFLLSFFLLPVNALAQPKIDSLRDAQMRTLEGRVTNLTSLSTNITDLEKKIEYQGNLNDKTLNSISSQISAASWNLTLFGILFSIVAVGLGIYITIVERKIVRISEENKELLGQNKLIKNEVVELNDLIQRDVRGLYQKLKREETVSIIDRLVQVPQDITNVANTLVSRDLAEEDFTKLSAAYHKMTGTLGEAKYKPQYLILFFQHFMQPTLKDELTQSAILDFMPLGISSCFPNDIIKSTKDFTSAVIDLGLVNSRPLITKYFEGLQSSQYRDSNEVYSIIFKQLATRSNQFDFFNLIDLSTATRESKKNFGSLLVNEYTDKTPTATEQLAFEQVNQITDELAAEQQAREAQQEMNQEAQA